MSDLRDIGGRVLDVVRSSIDRVGGNIQAGTAETAATVGILQEARDRIRTETELKRRREEQLIKVATVAVYAVVALLFVVVISKFVLKR